MAKVATSENARPDLDAIKHAVRELESPRVERDRERAELFAALYPDIRDQLIAGVSKTAIIKRLALMDNHRCDVNCSDEHAFLGVAPRKAGRRLLCPAVKIRALVEGEAV
ncbi:hypothetical protein [Paraburkholderia xenovorans]